VTSDARARTVEIDPPRAHENHENESIQKKQQQCTVGEEERPDERANHKRF